MIRRPPESTRTATRLPDPTLSRSARGAIGEHRVIEHPDITLGIGIDEIGRGHALPRHRRAPFGEIFRLVQPIIFGDHLCLVHPRIADREGALRILDHRSEEHTSELQSLMLISYAVFCLKKNK